MKKWTMQVRRRVRRLLAHSELFLGLAVGVLIGALIASVPLFPYVLPDSAASLLGAAAGAAIAVLGAIAVSSRSESRYAAGLIGAAQEAVHPLFEATSSFLERLKPREGGNGKINETERFQLTELTTTAEMARADLAQLKPAFDRRPDYLVAHVRLDNSIRALMAAFEAFARDDDVRIDMANHMKGRGPQNPPPPWMGPIPMQLSTQEIKMRLWKAEKSLEMIFNLA